MCTGRTLASVRRLTSGPAGSRRSRAVRMSRWSMPCRPAVRGLPGLPRHACSPVPSAGGAVKPEPPDGRGAGMSDAMQGTPTRGPCGASSVAMKSTSGYGAQWRGQCRCVERRRPLGGWARRLCLIAIRAITAIFSAAARAAPTAAGPPAISAMPATGPCPPERSIGSAWQACTGANVRGRDRAATAKRQTPPYRRVQRRGCQTGSAA